MPVIFEGTKIVAIKYNGTNIAKEIYQDETVFCQSCTANNSSCGTLCKSSSNTGELPCYVNPCCTANIGNGLRP